MLCGMVVLAISIAVYLGCEDCPIFIQSQTQNGLVASSFSMNATYDVSIQVRGFFFAKSLFPARSFYYISSRTEGKSKI